MLPRMAALDALGLVGSTVEQIRFDACVDTGGFALVYRGRHLGLDEDVAIKCLRTSHLGKSAEELRETITGRFRDETKILYRLSQGNLDIVRCISSGTLVAPATNELTPYMVLEWLEGRTLSADLRERREKKMRPRTIAETVELLDSAAGALAYAHAQGVVHRDVKPGNLFLTRTREGVRVKVLDFGLAKILSDEMLGLRPSVETMAGVHACSPSYGAPEQFNGKVGPVGPWTDIYSLALVMLEMLRGEKARPANNLAEGLLKTLDPETCSPRASKLGIALPTAIDDLLYRAVSKNPLERPSDAGAFWSALRELVAKSAPRSELQSTTYDAGVGDAMERVRAAQAGAPKASPFAGTMVMSNAPLGAPHLGPSRPGGSVPPNAGTTPLLGQGHRPAVGKAAPASPLAASMVAPSQPPPPLSPNAPTPIMAPVRVPVAPGPHAPVAAPARAPAPPASQGAPPGSPRATAPPRTAAPPPTGAAKAGSAKGSIALAVVVFVVSAAIGGAAIWWFLLRPGS